MTSPTDDELLALWKTILDECYHEILELHVNLEVSATVATSLVEDGKILKAQARLGHRDAATTLRHYAHAAPLDDLDVADELDRRLNEAVS